jgi:hypothetical protein
MAQFVSISFSAKRSAYSDMPSFSSHSAICCIAPRPCDGRYGVRREDIRPTLRGELPADLRGTSVSRTWGQGGDNIVGGDGSANALEFKLPNRLDNDGVFDRHQNTRANQNLTGLGFVAKPGCDIGHRPDGGIIEPSFEANGAERGISVGKMPKPISWLS